MMKRNSNKVYWWLLQTNLFLKDSCNNDNIRFFILFTYNRSIVVQYIQYSTYMDLLIIRAWAHRSSKLLNRSSLLSEPRFWEWGCSIRKRVKSNKQTDKIHILSGSLMSDIRKKECSKNVWKTHKILDLYIF